MESMATVLAVPVQELVKIGEAMGLKDQALQDFVREQQAIAREERAKERDAQIELERRKLQAEIKEKERAQQLAQEQDRQKLDVEREIRDREERTKERERAQQLQLERERLVTQVRVEEIRAGRGQRSEEVDQGPSKTRGPKMSSFDEKDDMDSYLHRFERSGEPVHEHGYERSKSVTVPNAAGHYNVSPDVQWASGAI